MTTQNQKSQIRKTHEIHEGVNGRGNTMWMVITINVDTGQYLWTEYFDNKAEAENWLEWVC